MEQQEKVKPFYYQDFIYNQDDFIHNRPWLYLERFDFDIYNDRIVSICHNIANGEEGPFVSTFLFKEIEDVYKQKTIVSGFIVCLKFKQKSENFTPSDYRIDSHLTENGADNFVRKMKELIKNGDATIPIKNIHGYTESFLYKREQKDKVVGFITNKILPKFLFSITVVGVLFIICYFVIVLLYISKR